ncbi:MAG: hypothetical protein JWQ58_2300 [Reyranella sp.]|nr:hypothetical protein [Reyranella sp.]
MHAFKRSDASDRTATILDVNTLLPALSTNHAFCTELCDWLDTLVRPHSTPERCTNLCFRGVRRNQLFMIAGQAVYAFHVEAQSIGGG